MKEFSYELHMAIDCALSIFLRDISDIKNNHFTREYQCMQVKELNKALKKVCFPENTLHLLDWTFQIER